MAFSLNKSYVAFFFYFVYLVKVFKIFVFGTYVFCLVKFVMHEQIMIIARSL